MMVSAHTRRSITSARITYMTPMRLKSVLVIHSRHRYGHQPLMVTRLKRPVMPTMSTHTVASGMGSWSGIASQVSLPNMTIASLVGCAAGQLDRCTVTVNNAVEEPIADLTEEGRIIVKARSRELRVTIGIQVRAARMGGGEPRSGVLHRYRPHVKAHVGEAIAAELSRDAHVGTGLGGKQIQPRLHARHGVDLTAELRHEEAIHHTRGGELEVHRCVHRDDELVQGRHLFLRINEEPLPIERDDFNLDRLTLALQGLLRVQVMRTDPGDAAEK